MTRHFAARAPVAKPKSVTSRSDSCCAGMRAFTAHDNAVAPSPVSKTPEVDWPAQEAPSTETAAAANAPKPSRPISDARNGSGGFAGSAAEAAEESLGGGDRAATTAAVDARLAYQPPTTRAKSRAVVVLDMGGDRGRVTRLGTKKTGSHLHNGAGGSSSQSVSKWEGQVE